MESSEQDCIEIDEVSSDDAVDTISLSAKIHDYPTFIYRKAVEIKRIQVGMRTLTRDDLLLLQPNRWLNDKIINAYLEIIEKSMDGQVKCFDTFFYPRIACNKFTRDDLKRCRMRGCRYLFFPIHQNNMHWSLVVYDFQSISYYDSLSQCDRRVLLNIKRFLEKALGAKVIHCRCMVNIPKQINGDDCGVFVCQYVKFIAFDLRFFQSSNINRLRCQMLHEILINKIIYKI